ncbi:MmgE/PrpD family protein [Rhizobium nepotum]|uniref:MmgE/PrpD family protein n=1 Tax=Rhizobium nepotum TaxID=1035271 RepID=UPI003CF61143
MMNGSHRPTLTEAISIAVATLRFEDIPTPVIDKAKTLIADTLSVAWAGRNAAGSPAVEALASNEGGREEATLWATGKRLPAASATFVNAFHAAALDYDSLNGNVHADIVTLPAACALAERQNASGRDFLTAYIAGAELMIRAGAGDPKVLEGLVHHVDLRWLCISHRIRPSPRARFRREYKTHWEFRLARQRERSRRMSSRSC